MLLPYAPGSRVVIRDEEWLIRRVDPAADGGWLLTCDGVSELVRGQSPLFLTELEERHRGSRPRKNRAGARHEPHLQRRPPLPGEPASAQRRQRRKDPPGTPWRHEPGAVPARSGAAGAHAATRPYPDCRRDRSRQDAGSGHPRHGADPAGPWQAHPRRHAKEHAHPVPEGVVEPLLDSSGAARLGRVSRGCATGSRRTTTRSTTSTAASSRSTRSRATSNTATTSKTPGGTSSSSTSARTWRHEPAKTGLSRRARLARMLATRSDTLMLLSATPHDGSARSFASLMSLLDPTAISDPDDYTPDDFRGKGLVIRRFKKDIRDQVKADFQERVRPPACGSRPARRKKQPTSPARHRLHPGGTTSGRQAAGAAARRHAEGACFPVRLPHWSPLANGSTCCKQNTPTADESAEVAGLDV